MHLAIQLSEKIESNRPVRLLVYHGSPTDIKDEQDMLPIDHARNIESEHIRGLVLNILDHKTTLYECLQLESPMKKVKKSWSLTIFYFVF